MLVRDGATLGEGFHHARGEAHAEVEALRDAARRGHGVAGATAYVTLEPCDHAGLTPPCTRALIAAGIARVVIGARDPNPRTAGAGTARLRAAGLTVDLRDDPEAAALVEAFAVAVAGDRPYVLLKIAASLDGLLAPEPGRYWLTGEAARRHVRERRAAADAVLVGIGTVRADDPQLTLRPPQARRRPYRRVVVCGTTPPGVAARIFAPAPGAAPATLLVPAAAARAYRDALGERAEIVAVPADASGARLDLAAALAALKGSGIESVLCEGGARLAGSLLAARLVDRVDWLVAPRFLANARAVPALAGADLTSLPPLRFDRTQRLGQDLLVSSRMDGGASCSAD